MTDLIASLSQRITERRAITTPLAGDFPAVSDTSEAAWKKALEELKRQHQNLCKVVSGLSREQFDEIAAGKDYPVAVMLHGTSQHYAYHAGQIALLKKLLSSA